MVASKGPTKGSLLIHGGGPPDAEFQNLFKDLAGPAAKLVLIPTAESDDKLRQWNDPITPGGLFGVPATILHTRDRAVADSDDFIQILKEATGVFIGGGRQPRLAEAYLHTRTHRELEHILERGGVIAGGSAGATIQGSFLIRNQGAPRYDADEFIDWDYTTEAFGFIKNVAIDQHVTQRGRQTHLAEALGIYPDLLGIGIDEQTTMYVHGNVCEVFGHGHVFVHDGPPPYYTLRSGQTFNLRSRRIR